MAVDLVWQDEASCLDAPDSERFFLIERGHQATHLMMPSEIWDLNRENFDHVKSTYCNTCPVRRQCAREGDRLGDSLWTVRGGRDPISFDPVRPDEVSSAKRRSTIERGAWEERDGVVVCKRAGHERSEVNVYFRDGVIMGLGECVTCKNEKRREHWHSAKMEG